MHAVPVKDQILDYPQSFAKAFGNEVHSEAEMVRTSLPANPVAQGYLRYLACRRLVASRLQPARYWV